MNRKIRVLVVDDDSLLRKLLTEQLSRAEFDAAPAASGNDALKILGESDFDVVLLDIMMAGLSGLIGKFLGVESAPIKFDKQGASWSVNAAKFVDMSAQPAMGLDPNNTEPLQLSNTGHPANSNFSLAHAIKSHVDALGLSWNDTSGKNNGQYAPFSWSA